MSNELRQSEINKVCKISALNCAHCELNPHAHVELWRNVAQKCRTFLSLVIQASYPRMYINFAAFECLAQISQFKDVLLFCCETGWRYLKIQINKE